MEVVNGVQEDGTRYPCWNPVLFQPQRGPLMLFYKVGPNEEVWWGMLVTSSDAGKTWSTPKKLPKAHYRHLTFTFNSEIEKMENFR